MKKFLITLSLMLGLISTSQMMAVKLASEEVLAQRLNEKLFAHFDQKTRIAEKLGGQERAVLGVIMTVNLAMADYRQEVSMNDFITTNMRKPELIETILQDSPEAVQEAQSLLKQMGQ